MSKLGVFTISLDFELFWGVRDHRTLENYGKSILGVRQAIPEMLRLFKAYNIHVTWATVGFLFFENKRDLLAHLPEQKPKYLNPTLSPYADVQQIGENEKSDPYHFGYSLIEQIRQVEFQEIGSHTFSHYYCLEQGQTPQSFLADARAIKMIAQERGIEIKSLVFPRNQFNEEYLSICKNEGIKAYRGNESSWLYEAKNREDESLIRRGFRLADAYIKVSSHNTHLPQKDSLGLTNVPSSRFLRPYSRKLAFLDGLRFNRIAQDMTYAAKNGEVFHLWWHPHNFGANLSQNSSFLQQILDHYRHLQDKYGMISRNMGEMVL